MDDKVYVVMASMDADEAGATIVEVHLSKNLAIAAAAHYRLEAARRHDLVNTFVVHEAPLKD